MTSMTEPAQKPGGGKPISGKTVLAWILGFFAVIFAANAVFIYLAIGSFPGVVTETAYEEGLAYNEEIAASREQALLNWTVNGSVSRIEGTTAAILVDAKDAAGAPLAGLTVTVVLVRPANAEPERTVVLQEGETGRYRAELADMPAGRWIVKLLAEGRDGKSFRSFNRIYLDE